MGAILDSCGFWNFCQELIVPINHEQQFMLEVVGITQTVEMFCCNFILKVSGSLIFISASQRCPVVAWAETQGFVQGHFSDLPTRTSKKLTIFYGKLKSLNIS